MVRAQEIQIKKPAITVAFPCFNPTEAGWLGIAAYLGGLRRLDKATFTFILVDDGSLRWVEPPLSIKNEIHIIRLDKNRGKGAALNEAVRQMPPGQDVFVFTDFDLPFAIDDLLGVCAGILGGSHVCIGDRTITENNKPSDRLSRRLSHRLFRFFIRTVVTGGFFDTQAGLKAFNPEAVRYISGKSSLNGFLFDVEWLYISCHHRLTVTSWPVHLVPGHDSSSLRSFVKIRLLREFMALLANIATRRYESPELTTWLISWRQDTLGKVF